MHAVQSGSAATSGEAEGRAQLQQLLSGCAPGRSPTPGASPAAGADVLKSWGVGVRAPGASEPNLAQALAALSPWLAAGCLSPRRVYAEVRAARLAGSTYLG